MQEYNSSKFRELLSEAIGTSSKQDFAKRAGMVPQQLSRYLREDYKSRPSRSTLKKISEAANDPSLYETLLKVCGYEETPAMIRKSKPFEDRAQLNAIDLKTGLAELTKGASIYSSLEEFLGIYEVIYSSEDITEIRKFARSEYNGAKYPTAEHSICVDLKFETPVRECWTRLVLYYAETKGGNVVVVGSDTSPRAIYDAGGMADEVYSLFKDKDFVYRASFKKGLDSGEALLNAIFGSWGDEYAYTIIGFGFYIPGLPEKFREFLERHKDSFCTSEKEASLYKKAMAGDDLAAVFKEYNDGLGKGFQAVIAKIMSEETDLPFSFFDPDEERFPENIPCVMLAGAVDEAGEITDEYNLEDLKEMCNGYASELGIASYGEVHIQSLRYINNKNVFKTI